MEDSPQRLKAMGIHTDSRRQADGNGGPDSEEEDNRLTEGHNFSTLGSQGVGGTQHPICPHLTQLSAI